MERICAVRERQVSSCAVTRFARVIGETHSLSRADLHLIALAHSLHTAQHGKFSLHQEPAAARAVSRGKAGTRVMPGWGATGGRWQDMDKMEEAERSQMEGLPSLVSSSSMNETRECMSSASGHHSWGRE